MKPLLAIKGRLVSMFLSTAKVDATRSMQRNIKSKQSSLWLILSVADNLANLIWQTNLADIGENPKAYPNRYK